MFLLSQWISIQQFLLPFGVLRSIMNVLLLFCSQTTVSNYSQTDNQCTLNILLNQKSHGTSGKPVRFIQALSPYKKFTSFKAVLDCEFQAVDSRFHELESGFFFSGTQILDFNCSWDSGFLELYVFQIPKPWIPDSTSKKLLRFRILRTKIFRIPLHGAQKILSQEPKCNCNYPVVPVSLGFRFSPVFHAVHRYHLYLH